MEPRDDFDRAGASLRARADALTRGHDPDEVVRLARRRRAWQGAAVGVATLAVVVGILHGLPQPPVDRIAIEPLVPSEPESAESGTGDLDTAVTPSRLDATVPALCDESDLAEPPARETRQASVTTTAPAPRLVAGSPLVAAEGRVYALRDRGGAGFATYSVSDEWRCWPSPDLTGPRIAIAGPGGAVLAVSPHGSTIYDPHEQRWSHTRFTGFDAAPLAGVWTGEEYLVVFEAAEAEAGSTVRAYEPELRSWDLRHAAPFAVNRTYHTSLGWDGERILLFGNALDGNNRAASQTAQLAAMHGDTLEWEMLPDSPLSAQAATAVIAENRMIAVDYEQQSATFDLGSGTWSEPTPTGIGASECPPELATDGGRVLVVACTGGAVLDIDSGSWTPFATGTNLTHPAMLGDGTALVWSVEPDADGAALMSLRLDDRAPGASACDAVTEFGTRLAATGITADDAAPTTPTELAGDADLIVAGTLTGEVEVANGPGPAGESYVAYELAVTDVVAGDDIVGDTIRVSIAFDGDPTRSAALTSDVPAGASAVVFAYEVTDAPGGWVAADGNGFAVACPGGPPLGQVGDGPSWSALADLDALADAARR